MTFPRPIFDNYIPSQDIYADIPARLVLNNLPSKFTGTPKISYLISTWNRQHQLSRTLESLARQEFKEFEILLMDDGSTQDITRIVKIFNAYLDIKFYQVKRLTWRSCASKAFKTMLPDARGEVIAISHPEVMLKENAMGYLYEGAIGNLIPPVAIRYTIEHPQVSEEKRYWVSLRPFFVPDFQYQRLDEIDWHSNFWNLLNYPGSSGWGGFAGQNNDWHRTNPIYPWWFASSCKKSDPIWDDLPVIDGHGIIDMWFYHYRSKNKFVDIVPTEVLCCHQPHMTTAFAPEGEQKEIMSRLGL